MLMLSAREILKFLIKTYMDCTMFIGNVVSLRNLRIIFISLSPSTGPSNIKYIQSDVMNYNTLFTIMLIILTKNTTKR